MERKTDEKDKSYEEVIKGSINKEECKPSKENSIEMEKTYEDDYRRDAPPIRSPTLRNRRDVFPRRPSTSRYQRSFNHCE
jgi:hypothetical protein